ncbi:MAG: DUF3847 domain-containing protein [Sporomusa sp.]
MKSLEEQKQKVETKLQQLQNREKILLNKKTDAERKTRTRRLIEHGAILESIFPNIIHMSGEEVKMFLSDISHLHEVEKMTQTHSMPEV